MKKRILILTFADHISDEQAEIIANTHRQATGLYSGAVLKPSREFTSGGVVSSMPESFSFKSVSESHKSLLEEIDKYNNEALKQGKRGIDYPAPYDFVAGEPVFQSESFCCDMCGNQKVGRRNKVYDENFVLQPDIYQCDECKNSEYEPDAVAEMARHFGKNCG